MAPKMRIGAYAFVIIASGRLNKIPKTRPCTDTNNDDVLFSFSYRPQKLLTSHTAWHRMAAQSRNSELPSTSCQLPVLLLLSNFLRLTALSLSHPRLKWR